MSNDKRKSDRETHDKAIGKEHRSTGWIKKISIVFLSCVLALTLATPMLHAEDLEIGPEIIGQPVRAVKPPIVNIVSIGDKTVSGKLTIGAGQRKSRKLDVTIRVIVNRKAGGTEEKTVTIPYTKSSQDWTVTLGLGSELAEGDKVTVTQEAGGEISKGVVREAKKSLSDQHKDELKMPSGEIWLENPDANLVNKDERAEAIEMLKKANPDIVNDFDLDPEKTKFSNDGPAHAYYEVTYTDGSTSGKIEATDLKIKKVTETSVAPTIEKVQVTDGQIIVTLDKEVAAGTKFYFIKNIDKQDYNNFCKGGNCKVDKSNSQEMSQAVSVDGKKVTFPINDDDLELEKEFGIVVKEPHKFRSCAKSEPVPTTSAKVAVRDPRKLTDDDKKAIDKAIRDANTVNGVSKLPNSREGAVYPAIIDFDKDGNARIIDPNYVEGTWDWDNYEDGKFIPEQNEDGTYKVKAEYQDKVISILAKDLVKNIAPKSPAIAVDTDKGEVTITPPAYKDPGDDTDLASYTITYKDASEAEKTVTATRDLGTNKWSGTGVDADTGVITLSVEKIELAGTIKATAKDNGGLEGDTDKLDSDPATKKLETATVSYDVNKGTGKMDGKKLNKGSKYTILDNAFTAPENQEFDTWEVNGKKLASGTEITVDKDTIVKAIWKESRVKLKITTSVTNGTIDPSCDAYKGDNKTINYAPKDGYKLKSVTVDGAEVDISKYPSSYTFTNLDKNHEIAVAFELPTYTVTYKWDGVAPEGKAVPKDTGSYHKGDHYDVDATYKKGDTVKGEKDGKKGTWTFSGWTDPNNGTMGEANAKITGKWTFEPAPTYTVTYDWGKDAPAGKDLPQDNGSYYKGDTYKVDDKYKKGTTVTDKTGTWTFSGWTDPNNGTMGEGNVTITGTWTFKKTPDKPGTTPGTTTPGTSDKPGKTTPGTSDKPGTTTPGTSKTPETSTPSQKEGKANMTNRVKRHRTREMRVHFPSALPAFWQQAVRSLC